MAWYAELKRIKWYCINGWDAITWYSDYLYDEWWNSLTDEDKKKIEEYRRKKEEQRRKELDKSIMKFCMLLDTIDKHLYRY